MATDLSTKGTVLLGEVQDVFGMCGRHKGATESRILQCRDARSVRVLVTGTTTPTPEGPLGSASPQVRHVSGKIDNSCARLRPPAEKPLGNASPQVTHMSGITDDLFARLRPPSEKPRGNADLQVTHVSGKIDDSCARLRPPSEKPCGNAGPQVTHVSGKIDDLCAWLRPPSEKPLGNAGPQVTHMSGISDGLCASPMPPGRRRRSQRWIPNTATHVASRLTEQDPRMTTGAMVFDCRPAVLPVSVDVSGIDIQSRLSCPPSVSRNSQGRCG